MLFCFFDQWVWVFFCWRYDSYVCNHANRNHSFNRGRNKHHFHIDHVGCFKDFFQTISSANWGNDPIFDYIIYLFNPGGNATTNQTSYNKVKTGIQAFSNIPLEHTPDPEPTVYELTPFPLGLWGGLIRGMRNRGMLGFS